MKIKSRIIAMAVCIVSAVSLTACGEKTAEFKPLKTEEPQAVEVGTILVDPEMTTEDIGKVYLKFTSQDEDEQSATDVMSIAFDMTGKNIIFYVTDGDKQANAVIYEIAQSGKGKAAKYIKNANSNVFKKDKKTKKATIDKEAYDMINFVELFGFVGMDSGSCPVGETMMKYKKCEDEVSELFGDVYVYELVDYFDNDSSYGFIWVDKDTGVWVRTLDENGEEVTAVQELELEDVKMPVYK